MDSTLGEHVRVVQQGEQLTIYHGPGVVAITAGYTVLFTTATALIVQLVKARAEGRLEERLLHFTKSKLLIIDELGYLPVEPDAAHVLFQLVSRRYERAASSSPRTGRSASGATSSATRSSRRRSSTGS